ncbi:MAG: VOC family protein, partial [Chloroflexota bacterium]|nr:VOC family protein [Chloroflexota bacterium]
MDPAAPAVHHIGVAVPSIDEAMRFYTDKLGLPLEETLELPDRQLRVAFVRASNTLIELLEPTDPDTTVARFLERRGPG